AGTKTERETLIAKLTQFSGNPAIEELLASLADGASSATRVTALRVMAAGRARELPRSWIEPLSRALTSDSPDAIRAAVVVPRAVPPAAEASAGLNASLLRVARDGSMGAEVRLDALAAVTGG